MTEVSDIWPSSGERCPTLFQSRVGWDYVDYGVVLGGVLCVAAQTQYADNCCPLMRENTS